MASGSKSRRGRLGSALEAALEHRQLQRGGVERVLDLVRQTGGQRADGGQLLGALRPSPELAPLLDEAHLLQRLRDGEQEIAGRRRLDQIGEGARAHRGGRRLGAGVAGQEDHLRVGRGAP